MGNKNHCVPREDQDRGRIISNYKEEFWPDTTTHSYSEHRNEWLVL